METSTTTVVCPSCGEGAILTMHRQDSAGTVDYEFACQAKHTLTADEMHQLWNQDEEQS